MMNKVFVLPFVIREERQHACNDSENHIRLSAIKERVMATVMEYDEDPDQKPGCRNRERQCKPK
jgi:hypothetical protein